LPSTTTSAACPVRVTELDAVVVAAARAVDEVDLVADREVVERRIRHDADAVVLRIDEETET
jgi:hypothetical protein